MTQEYRCPGCDQSSDECWRSEDCPGGRHYEREQAREAELRRRADDEPRESRGIR